MANIAANSSTNYAGIPGGWRRGGAYSLDPTEVYATKAAAESYAQSDVTAYVGQKLVVVEDGVVTHYGIEPDGSLKELGAATLGDDKTITLGDGNVLSLKNFGKQYYKNDGSLATGFIAGLQPKVRLADDGTLELAWYEPSSTTVEGLSEQMSSLSQTVNTMQGTVSSTAETVAGMYTNDQIDQAIADAVSEIPEWVEV